MQLLVDADACPVVAEAVALAKKYGVAAVLFCDTNHLLQSDYAQVQTIGAGRDAVDLAVANHCRRGDIVVTQDYALAALILGRGGYALHQNGFRYTDENIDGLLAERWQSAKARRAKSKNHLRGPKKRTADDDARFVQALEALLQEILGQADK